MKGGGGGSRKKSYTKYTAPLGKSGSLFDKDSSNDDCRGLKFFTTLEKAQIPLSSLSSGDMLSIQITDDLISVHNVSNEICGYIISAPESQKLYDCIIKGNRYTATVISITGVTCNLHIKHT